MYFTLFLCKISVILPITAHRIDLLPSFIVCPVLFWLEFHALKKFFNLATLAKLCMYFVGTAGMRSWSTVRRSFFF